MQIEKNDIKSLITILGFRPMDGIKEIYYKYYSKHDNYIIKIDFDKEIIEYGDKIKLGDLTTSNFENNENFVVLECVDRLLEKGYLPERLVLENKWLMGRKEKGKLDILVNDKENKAYLMIECKTWGNEYNKEKKKMLRNGGQLFSYFQQDKSTQYLCLYSSHLENGEVRYVNDIIKIDNQWRELNNQKEIFDYWNKNFKDNGLFDDWTCPYNIEIKALTRGRLKELTEEDSGRIFNQFAEILRHNVVSDKPNAFNKILNLFICKIIDEDKNDNDEVAFQWREDDTYESLQIRLNDLYKDGMKRFLDIEVTDYSDKQLEDKLYNLNDPTIKKQIQNMFQEIRLQKNPEFAFKEVYDEESFISNAIVVKEVVELLQPYQFRYGHKQQFLGNFFELLLNTSIKQEAGQFFTPVPIARFIISCFPIKEFILKKIEINAPDVLPYMIDYAAGSGHFLTEWMDIVQSIINSIECDKSKTTSVKRIKLWKEGQFDWAREFVYGIEADYRLVKTTKVSSFLNGDGEAMIIRANGLDNFEKSYDYKGKLSITSQEDPRDNEQFDILVANPPYSVSAFKNTIKYGNESFELYNKLTDDSSEIECLFIERTKQLLKPGGYAGIILPSSILNNSGIYTGAREIILKYFNIKAIVEFGSNTFMATGTNTVTLFLERRSNYEWKKIQQSIINFFDNPQDAIVLGIENAFSKYVNTIFEGISLDDYISLVIKNPNKAIKEQECYKDYVIWFNNLAEIKNLKTKKAFKDLSDKDKQEELDRLFYNKVFEREQEKLLYFLLVCKQNAIIVKVGEKQAEKDFLGYEFSMRRGHEGIKVYTDSQGKLLTKLFDIDNLLNEKKANSYIYKFFLDEPIVIDKELEDNISVSNLVNLIDFSKIEFEKVISLNTKKKIKTLSKWKMVKLKDNLVKVLDDRRKPITKRNRIKGSYPYYGATGIIDYVNDYIFDEDIVLIGEDGAKWGPKEKCAFVVNDKCWVNNHAHVLRVNKTELIDKYLVIVLNELDLMPYITGLNVPKLNQANLLQIKIPLPPKNVQEKIVSEIDVLEMQEKQAIDKIKSLNEKIKSVISNIFSMDYELKRLGDVAEIVNGGTPNTTISEYWNGDICWASIADTKNKYLYDTAKKITMQGVKNSNAKTLPVNTVLFSSRATIGDVCITKVETCTNQGYKNFITNPEVIYYEYLYYILRHEAKNIERLGSGMTYTEISKKKISNYKIPVPPISEQEKTVADIDKIEQEVRQIKQNICSIDEKKESILKKYLKY